MSASTIARRPASGTLYDVVDVILDKGLVIDAFVRVSLVGVELLTIDARIVIASVDTYLHYAEAANRLDLRSKVEEHDTDLPDIVSGMSEDKAAGAIEGGVDKIKEKFASEEQQGQE